MTAVDGVHREPYAVGADGDRLRYADDELLFCRECGDYETIDRIPAQRITAVRVDVDRSLTGFRSLATAFGGFAVLFSVLAVPLALSGAAGTIALGIYAVAALSWYGVWFASRLEVAPLGVLEVETDEDSYVFLARGADAFDELAAVLKV
jgi:hypothetical protein